MTAKSRVQIGDENYIRKHEVIWHEDFLLYPAGCKSWPNNNIDFKKMQNKINEWNAMVNDDDIELHKMLNEIKNKIKTLDYTKAKKETTKIYKIFKEKKGIKEGVKRIKHKMKHIGKSKYFKADKYDRLMLFAEFNGSKRERYSREYDRILVTKSFRHLQYKTQVMVNTASDDQRTRLLHSLEVQRIAKTLAIQLGANSNLAQTIAIGHDVGHAPFGHAGESALNDRLSKGCFGEFSHALQSVKVLNYMEKHPIVKRYGFSGLGLSIEVLSGILKHDTDTFRKDVSRAAFRLQYNRPCVAKYYPGEKAEKLEKLELTMGTIEAQIVYWADKIAYIGHDWEEFVLSSHIEKMLYDMNEIWEKIGIANAIYEENKDKIDKDKEVEYKKLNKIHGYLKSMNGIFNDDESNGDKNNLSDPLKKNKKRKVDLNKNIKELLKVEDDVIPHKNKNTAKHKTEKTTMNCKNKLNCTLLSRNEYNMLFDYFRVAKAWMYITGRIPKKYKECNDIIYIIYRFFKDTISQRTTPKIETNLIENTRNKTNLMSDQQIVVKASENWNRVKEKILKKDKEEAKDAFIKSLTVTLSKKMRKNLKIVDEFKYQYYIGSKEVQYMTDKASLVIQTLFDYFLDCPEMLPDECLEEYCLLVDGKYIDYKELVVEYLSDEYSKCATKAVNFSKGNCQKTIARLKYGTTKEEIEKMTNDHLIKKRMKKLHKVIKDLDDLSQDELSLIRKGRQTSIFNNKWAKQNELIDLFKSRNHVSRTILARIIADYICSMTDRMAILKYNEITSSTTSWTEKYNA